MAAKKTADRPRLGRGLAALLGDSTSAAGAVATIQQSSITNLPIESLEPSPFQPRQAMDPESLAELANSIRIRGVLQPLLARAHPDQEGVYQIIAGERRWRAAQQAGLHEVPVHLRDFDDVDAMAAALVENLQRADLNPIEEAEGFNRLIEEYRLTQDDLARALGKSRPHITNTLRLLRLPEPLRREVGRGVLSAGHARALLGHPDPIAAARDVIARDLSVRQTEALVQKSAQAGRDLAMLPAKPERRDPEIASLERDLSAKLGLRVQVQFDGKGGSIRFAYRTLDQLDSLLALLNR